MKVHTLADCMPAGLVSEKIGFKHGLLGRVPINRMTENGGNRPTAEGAKSPCTST